MTTPELDPPACDGPPWNTLYTIIIHGAMTTRINILKLPRSLVKGQWAYLTCVKFVSPRIVWRHRHVVLTVWKRNAFRYMSLLKAHFLFWFHILKSLTYAFYDKKLKYYNIRLWMEEIRGWLCDPDALKSYEWKSIRKNVLKIIDDEAVTFESSNKRTTLRLIYHHHTSSNETRSLSCTDRTQPRP